MQEKIIRSCLKDPFMYGDSTFCTGCGRHRPDREFIWRETGENLHAYMERLRARAAPGLMGLIRQVLHRLRHSLG